MSILEQICVRKRDHVAEQKRQIPQHELEKQISENVNPHIFSTSLKRKSESGSPAVIAEIKKASPSAGLIRPDFDVAEIAKAYESGGASCLSILTDTPYFQGEDKNISLARKTCTLPILRKDFMVDIYQVYETRALGADCILIIMAALDDALAKDMMTLAHEYGMDALVEVHTQDELERAVYLSPSLLGVNCRDLKEQVTNFSLFESFASQLPKDMFLIAESGIKTRKEIKQLRRLGYQGFLIGEQLMRQNDPCLALQSMLDLQ